MGAEVPTAVDDQHAVGARDGAARLRLSSLPAQFWPLAGWCAAVLLALWAYGPAVGSSWTSDDFLFMRSANTPLDGGYLDGALGRTPASSGFRPLSYATIVGGYELLGDDPLLLHLLLFAAHAVMVGTVMLLVLRFTGHVVIAVVAGFAVAVHPVGFESIAWVSAMSTWGFPLAFVSWYCILVASSRPAATGWRVASAVGFVAALGFRETAALVIVAMVATVWASTGGLRRTLWLLAPHLLVCALGAVASWYASRDNAGYGAASAEWPAQAWGQLERALGSGSEVGVGGTIRTSVATACLLAPLVAWRLGRPMVAGLGVGLLATAAGSSFVADGDQARYFYLSAAMFVLLVATTAASIPRSRGTSAALLGGCLALIGWWTVTLRDDMAAWVAAGPEVYDEFVTQLEEEVGDAPPSGRLSVSNAPLQLALFDGLYIDGVAGTLWGTPAVPTELVPVETVASLQVELTPEDHMVVFRPDEYGCVAERRQPRPEGPAPIFVEADLEPGDSEPFELEVVRIGPLGAGAGEPDARG